LYPRYYLEEYRLLLRLLRHRLYHCTCRRVDRWEGATRHRGLGHCNLSIDHRHRHRRGECSRLCHLSREWAALGRCLYRRPCRRRHYGQCQAYQTDFSYKEITIDRPFQLACQLMVLGPALRETSRTPSFVIQRLLPIRTTVVGPQREETRGPQQNSITLSSGQSTPSPTGTPP